MRVGWRVLCAVMTLGCGTGVPDGLADEDGDGLGANREERLGLDPNDPDTDDDGLTDGEEVDKYLTDPLDPDTDDDGLLDGAEIEAGTDPFEPDTDGDGLTDGEEVNQYGSDPNSRDTDGDGLRDGEEVRIGTDPTKVDTDGDGLDDPDELEGGTDPTLADTDADGLDDGVELKLGTDPTNPDTDGDGALDGEEVASGSDPLVGDSDGDGLLDGQELKLGTDPTLADTDGDTLDDGREVNEIGSDPLLFDTDGDGLDDGEEVEVYRTDPTLVDTDGDTLSDFDEVVTHGTNPRDADVDGDGLDDAAELAAGTDTRDPDSDGDGLLDGDEVLKYLTDPTLSDSDGDGLSDGVEIQIHTTDPNQPDTDSDGLDDREEVDVYFTDPLVDDTDSDGLIDGDEIKHGADPLLPDSDYGGVPDGQEVNTDSTNPTSASDDVCTYLDLAVADADHTPTTPAFDPRFLTFEWQLVANANGVHDAFADYNADGLQDPEEELAARLRITVYDPEWTETCVVEFDAGGATRIEAPSWALTSLDGSDVSSSASIVEARTLTPSTGTSTCPALDASVYGSDDIRDVLAGLDFGFGFGDLDALEQPLQELVGGEGIDWDARWSPGVYGSWLTWDDTTAHLVGYGFVHQATCGEVDVDAQGNPIPNLVNDPLPAGLWTSGYELGSVELTATTEDFGHTAFHDFADVTGIDCGQPDLDLSDEDWTYDSATPMDAVGVRFEITGLVTGDGALEDYQIDLDGDGTLEQVGASVTAVFVDSDDAPVCFIVYDASAAEPVDNPSWTLTQPDGTAGGPLDRAWTLALENGAGNGDCGRLDAKVWSNQDPEAVLEGISFGFGTGATGSVMDGIGSAQFDDWTKLADDTFSIYISIDAAAVESNFAQLQDLDDCFEVDIDEIHDPAWFVEGRLGRLFDFGGRIRPPF